MSRVIQFMLRVERAFHLVDAYLYYHQGKHAFAANAECKAYECERKIITMEINHA